MEKTHDTSQFPPRKLALAAFAGLVVGALLIILFRFFLIAPPVHYHANFQLFVDGKQETFDSFTYYEEVEACSADPLNNPKSRIHLHQPNNDVVHVHSAGVTWAMLFENINLALSDRLVETEAGVFVDGANGKELVFILNGEQTNVIANKVVGDEDVLLVSYDKSGTDFMRQYQQIKATAGEYNATADPAACSGRDTESISERLKYALFGLTTLE